MWLDIYFSNSSAVPYPETSFLVGGGGRGMGVGVLEGCHFLTSIVRKKTVVHLRSLKGTVNPPLWDPFWLFCILHSSKHRSRSSAVVICLFLGKLIFIILTVWRSEFEISSQYTGLKIALDTTLVSPVITQFGIKALASFCIKTCYC